MYKLELSEEYSENLYFNDFQSSNRLDDWKEMDDFYEKSCEEIDENRKYLH